MTAKYVHDSFMTPRLPQTKSMIFIIHIEYVVF